jgi:hypothetical protein
MRFIMTSKTLAHPPGRPLTGIAFWMVCSLTILWSSASGAGLLEMTELMAHPEQYDRQDVVVMGKVNNVQPVTDKQGQPAFKFFLEDASGTLKVITRTEVQEGDQVIVEGVFSRRRQGGRIKVYNEVNATSIRPLNVFNPDLLG